MKIIVALEQPGYPILGKIGESVQRYDKEKDKRKGEKAPFNKHIFWTISSLTLISIM